ncbi:MAG: hypothetical protein HZA14_11150 [Nitrospirae bacterium]|nr:hypothetical protein [Nitrospirota bacterium]
MANTVGGKTDPRPPIPVLAGLLAYKSSWSPPFGDSFREYLSGMNPSERIDIGCSICDGGFEITFNTDSKLQIETSTAEQALVFFLLKLLHKLQTVGTVTAIDYLAYTKWLK